MRRIGTILVGAAAVAGLCIIYLMAAELFQAVVQLPFFLEEQMYERSSEVGCFEEEYRNTH